MVIDIKKIQLPFSQMNDLLEKNYKTPQYLKKKREKNIFKEFIGS